MRHCVQFHRYSLDFSLPPSRTAAYVLIGTVVFLLTEFFVCCELQHTRWHTFGGDSETKIPPYPNRIGVVSL